MPCTVIFFDCGVPDIKDSAFVSFLCTQVRNDSNHFGHLLLNVTDQGELVAGTFKIVGRV